MESEKKEKGNRLLESSKSGDLDMVKLLVEKEKVDINFADRYGLTALHHAARWGHASIVRYLVSKGATIDVEATPDYPITPLVCAVRRGHVDVVDFLVKQGASTHSVLEETNIMGEAIFSGKAEMINLLLDNGHTLDQYDSNGDTPLMKAFVFTKYSVASFLLDKGADYKKLSLIDNLSPLHYAMSGKDHPDNTRLIMLLLKHVEKVEGNVGVVRYVNHGDSKGRTSLHRACHLRNYNAVRILLSHGADQTVKDADGNTPSDLIHRLDYSHVANQIRSLFDSGRQQQHSR